MHILCLQYCITVVKTLFPVYTNNRLYCVNSSFWFWGETLLWHSPFSVLVHVLRWRAGINSLRHTSVLVWLARVCRERERESNGGHRSSTYADPAEPDVCFSQEHSRKPSALPALVLCERHSHSSSSLSVCPSHKATLSSGAFHQRGRVDWLYNKVSEWEVEENRRMGWRSSESTTRFPHFLPHRLQRSEENLSQIKPLPLRAKAEPQEKRERVRRRVEKLPNLRDKNLHYFTPNSHHFLSSVQHKRRYFEEIPSCSFPRNICVVYTHPHTSHEDTSRFTSGLAPTRAVDSLSLCLPTLIFSMRFINQKLN